MKNCLKYKMVRLLMQGQFGSDSRLYSSLATRSSPSDDKAYSICINYCGQDYDPNPFAPVELSARYISYENSLPNPIFSYQAYRNAGISFYTFLFSQQFNDKTLLAVLLFDNYETGDAKQFNLRFAFRYPVHESKDLKINEYDLTQISKVLEIACEQGYADKFSFTLGFFGESGSKTPETDDANKSKLLPADRLFLLQQFAAKNYVRCFSKNPAANISYEKQYGRLMPYIRNCCAPSIEIPYLNSGEWFGLQHLQTSEGKSILSNDYHCVLADGSIPAYAQDLAKLYARYLANMERYDFVPYRGSQIGEHEIYFIISPDYKICIGVFIFSRTDNCSEFLDRAREFYENYMHQWNITDENALLDRLQSEQRELEEKIAQRPPAKGLSDFLLRMPTKQEMVEDITLSDIKAAIFWGKAKTSLPEDTRQMAYLRVAWIHPFHQRHGIMLQLWSEFKRRYGCIVIEAPSEAMQGFIKKYAEYFVAIEGGDWLALPKESHDYLVPQEAVKPEERNSGSSLGDVDTVGKAELHDSAGKDSFKSPLSAEDGNFKPLLVGGSPLTAETADAMQISIMKNREKYLMRLQEEGKLDEQALAELNELSKRIEAKYGEQKDEAAVVLQPDVASGQSIVYTFDSPQPRPTSPSSYPGALFPDETRKRPPPDDAADDATRVHKKAKSESSAPEISALKGV